MAEKTIGLRQKGLNVKNYLVSGLNPEQENQLNNARIPLNLFEQDGLRGFVFEEGAPFNRALQVLNAQSVSSRPTAIDGLIAVTLEIQGVRVGSVVSAVNVIVPHGYKCGHWEWLVEELRRRISLMKLRVPVSLYHLQGERVPSLSSTTLSIVLDTEVSGKKQLLDGLIVRWTPMRIGITGLPPCPRSEDCSRVMKVLREFIPKVVSAEGFDPAALQDHANRVDVGEWNGEHKQTFSEMVGNILGPVWPKRFEISVPHGIGRSPFKNSDVFHVYVWSFPGEDGQTLPSQACPSLLFGLTTSCRDSVQLPFESSNGMQIVDAGTGWVVAQVVENNLYIHHDICHYGQEEEVKLFCKILEEAAKLIPLINSPEKRQEFEKRRLEITKKNFISMSQQAMISRIDQVRAAEKKGIEDEAQARSALVEAIRLQKMAAVELELLTSRKTNEVSAMEKEFDHLLKLPHVLSVDIGANSLLVKTDVLCCPDTRTGKVHEIGAFRISVVFGGQGRGMVRWQNTTRQVNGYRDGMQAPHVYNKGDACLGNVAETFAELIARYDVVNTVALAIQFIESANTDDQAGRFIDRWPVAKKEALKAAA